MSGILKVGRGYIKLQKNSAALYVEFINLLAQKNVYRTNYEYVVLAPKSLKNYELERLASKWRVLGSNIEVIPHGHDIGLRLRSNQDLIPY